jgi:hypothetical protein
VWTAPMRQGDFSGLFDSTGRKITLYDPWSVGPGPSFQKTPYVNNQLPVARLSPLAKYVFGVVPLPTDVGVNPLIANNYFGPAPTNSDQRTAPIPKVQLAFSRQRQPSTAMIDGRDKVRSSAKTE